MVELLLCTARWIISERTPTPIILRSYVGTQGRLVPVYHDLCTALLIRQQASGQTKPTCGKRFIHSFFQPEQWKSPDYDTYTRLDSSNLRNGRAFLITMSHQIPDVIRCTFIALPVNHGCLCCFSVENVPLIPPLLKFGIPDMSSTFILAMTCGIHQVLRLCKSAAEIAASTAAKEAKAKAAKQ
eukprot:scaffold8081_cov79-Skeletonema_marinoi.AAC.1